jgi:beta-glucosidase
MTIEQRYQDATLSIDERISDLLDRMTVEEKIAQLGSVWAFEIVGPDGLDADPSGRSRSWGSGRSTARRPGG